MSNATTSGARYVEVEPGVRVYMEDTGLGKPIVFVHAWPFDHRTFEYQFNELPRHGYRCVGIDLRGYGKSDKPYGEYDYDVFADDLSAVIEALDLQDTTLLGHSMGSGIAVHYMARHSGRGVAKLVLVAPTTPVFSKRDDFPYLPEKSEMEAWIEAIEADRPQAMANAVKQLFHREGSITPEFAEWYRSLAMDASAHATTSCFALMRDADLRPDLAQIKVPTAIFHAVDDQIAPFALGEQLQAGIAGSKLIRFENSGHGPFYDERRKFNDELMRFVG